MALMFARSEAVSNGGPDPLIRLVKRRCGVVLTKYSLKAVHSLLSSL
jgi:hypothetical protein